MGQISLIANTLSDALEELVNQLKWPGEGRGKKAVGKRLYPSVSLEEAGKKVSRCLDPDHCQKFSLAEIDLILRWGREQNIHVVAEYIGEALSYDVTPKSLEDLEREAVNEADELAEKLDAVMEKLERVKSLRGGE